MIHGIRDRRGVLPRRPPASAREVVQLPEVIYLLLASINNIPSDNFPLFTVLRGSRTQIRDVIAL